MATRNINEEASLSLFPSLVKDGGGGNKWDATYCHNGVTYQVELKAKTLARPDVWCSNKTDLDMLADWERERDFYLFSEHQSVKVPPTANDEHYIMFRRPILNNPTSQCLFPVDAIGMRQQYEEWRRIIYRGEYKTKVCDLGLDKWLKIKKLALEEFKNEPDFSEWQEGIDRAEKKLTRINAKKPWHYIRDGGWRVRSCTDIDAAVAHQIKTYGSLK